MAISLLFLPFHSASAENCPLPSETTGPIVMRVFEHGPDSYPLQFDLTALQEMPLDHFQTTTVWTDGLQSFEGIRLKTLLDCLGVESGVLTLVAQNDYSIDIPFVDVDPNGPLLAFKRNGAFMTVRDKGPIWLVYPYDQHPEYQTETAYSRSIWQLDHITITP